MLKDNLTAVEKKIVAALAARKAAKKTGDTVCLVAVTKNHPVQIVAEAWAAGLWHIGENKVQEARGKKEFLPVETRSCWHLIGHLQTNKVRQAVGLFDIIESVDSERLAAAINSEAMRQNKIQDVLLQLNLTREEQKSGFLVEEYWRVLPLLLSLKNLRVRGIMVIAKEATEAEETRSVFSKGYSFFCDLQDKLGAEQCSILSMGMTHDYWVAIEEGANSIRLGTALFGPRD